MELAVLYSRALTGISAPLVRVEIDLSNGLPAFHIVGLPETAVRESKDRVRSAILNSSFAFPDRRITVNLAPADLPKEGGRFDLPIALGILIASGQLPNTLLHQHEFVGELALDGSLRAVPGAIPAAQQAVIAGRALVVPPDNARLAAYVPHSKVIEAADILTLCAHLNGNQPIVPAICGDIPKAQQYPDMCEITGQEVARRALEIAASGGHNLLFNGPPGTGKTLLASRLPGILPPATPNEALTGLALHSFYDANPDRYLLQRPFRSPHHSASSAALVGGGGKPQPGEISLAHGGVLFLDELPEFSRQSLEMLREPLESGEICLARAQHKVTYPARFQLVAAMNPCPCGYLGDAQRACRCSEVQLQRYRQRISGPLLDRIDMHVMVSRLRPGILLKAPGSGEPSALVRQRVSATHERQMQRQQCPNNQLNAMKLARTCLLEKSNEQYLSSVAERMHLSARAIHRSLRVARTIADMEGAKAVERAHINEAIGYRQQDLLP